MLLILSMLFIAAPTAALADDRFTEYDHARFRRICGNSDRSSDCYTRVVNEHLRAVARGGNNSRESTSQTSRDPGVGATQTPGAAPGSRAGISSPGAPPGATAQNAPPGADATADPGVPDPARVGGGKTSPGTAASLANGMDTDELAKRATQEKIADTEREIANRKGIAERERGLADVVARSYDSIQNYVKPRQASADQALQQQAASRLREPVSFPSEYQPVTDDIGLRTNHDVQSRAPEYVQKWADDADKQDKRVAQLEQDNAKGRLAERELSNFQDTLSQRVTNMNSVGGSVPAAQAVAAYPSATRNGAGVATTKASPNGQSRITSSKDEKLPSGQSKGIARGLASVADGKNGSEITAAGGTIIDPKTGKPATGESLREILKRRLAATREKEARAGAAGGSGDGARKSSFEQFFEGKAAEGAGKNAAEGPQAEAEGKPGFFLSGVETDKVVARLVGSLDGREANGGNDVFGSADISIFQRITAFLRKAEAGKKVAGQ